MKLYEYLARYGREAGSRLFYRDDEGSLTYGEALGEARRWADFCRSSSNLTARSSPNLAEFSS